MPINEFSSTAVLLQQQYFPGYTFDANSNPTDTAVAAIITKKAAAVSGILTSVGVAPAGISIIGEPIAFNWLQDLVLVGTAAHVARAFTGRGDTSRVASVWRTEWTQGLEVLRNPQKRKDVLADVLTGSQAGFLRTHVQSSSDSPPTAVGDIDLVTPSFTADMDL